MSPRDRPTVGALALAALSASSRAAAFDAEVRADTQAQAYQVRGPGNATLLSLRRITQTLTLGGVERTRRMGTWSVRARLRLDSDFGSSCDPTTDRCLDELNRSRAADFAPLFARRSVDLPFAYLEGSGLIGGSTTVRLGRQLVIDPLGFFLFDGARARVSVAGRVVFEAYGGLETRTGFPLSNGRYERDGVIRADRTGWDPSLASRVRDASLAGAVAAAVETAGDGPVFARATWRRVWGADGVAEEKLGASVDVTLSPSWRAFAEAVHSIPQQTVANLTLGASYADDSERSFGVELSRWRPTFDLTSVWASFWTDPTDDARVRGALPLGRGWTVTASTFGRRYALSESPASPSSPLLSDAWAGGGDGALLLRRPRYEGSLRAHGEGGELGVRAGADLTGRAWLRWQVLRVDAALSAWWVDDPLRPERSVASLGVMAGATVRIGRVADVQLNVEDDVNRIVGHRLRAVAVVTLRMSN